MPALLPQPAVPVAYDLALWFLDRARAADSHLPAQKLQNLLFLAALHYEHAHGGRALAPFAFVADHITVADPNLYRLLEEGRPTLRAEPVPPAIEAFLEEIWSRYGHARVERLNTVVRRVLAADGELLPAELPEGLRPPELAAGVGPVTSAAVLRPTHLGRQVAVAPWRPPSAPRKI